MKKKEILLMIVFYIVIALVLLIPDAFIKYSILVSMLIISYYKHSSWKARKN